MSNHIPKTYFEAFDRDGLIKTYGKSIKIN